MIPRNAAEGNPNIQQQQQQADAYAQQYGGGSRSNMNRGSVGGGYLSSGLTGYSDQLNSVRRFTISGNAGGDGRSPNLGDQSQQIPIQGGVGMGMGGGGDLMGNHSQRSLHSQQHAQGYRSDLTSNSPSNHNSLSQAYYGSEQLSPTHFAHRMSLGFYPMSGGSGTSPNFAAMTDPMDLSGRGLASSMPAGGAGGPGGPLTQADREEELLLNLLIARRQRGRMTGDGKGRSQASLADDLMRLRQSRAAQGQHRSGSIPQMPGMPPLFADTMSAGGGVHPNMYPGSGMDVYHRGASMKSDALLPHHQIHRQIQDMSERIDRSPGRFPMADARMSEMREMSERSMGVKRGLGSIGMGGMGLGSGMGMGMPPMGYDALYNYPGQLEMQGTDVMPPAKKKRTHKKKPADMPRRPLSAYNLFFSEERERILKEIERKEGKDEGEEEKDDVEVKTGEEPPEGSEVDKDEKPKALLRSLIPAQKKRRPHRKTHGKISFQQLARMVGERWKNLPDDERKYYQDLAHEDMKRQKTAMEDYYANQNSAKLKSNEVIKLATEEASELPDA